MKRLLIITACLLTVVGLRAQPLRTCRYWYDRDFGDAIATSFNGNNGQLQLNVETLAGGLHTLHLQVADSSLNWGATKSFLFMKPEDYGVEILSYRYWFDQDYDNSVSEDFGDGTFLLDVSELESGMHTLHVLFKGSTITSTITSTKSYLFMKPEDQGVEILSYRYWFDQDYDNSVSEDFGDGTFLLDVSELESGMHTLHVLFEGSTITSTITSTKSYLFMKPEDQGMEILSYRYWFDQDYDNSVSEDFGDGTFLLDVLELESGMHTLHILFEGSTITSTITSTKSYLFMKPEDYGVEILSYRYWFDQDYDNSVSEDFGNGTFLLDVSELESGMHTLHVLFEGSTITSTITSTKSYLFMKPEDQGFVSYRSWFDFDIGNQQTGSIGNGSLLLDVSNLSEGIHTMHIQLEGNTMTSTKSYLFLKVPAVEDCQYRCWFDEDDSTVQTGQVSGGVFLLDVTALSFGQHDLFLQLSYGDFTSPMNFSFFRGPAVLVSANPEEGGAAEVQLCDSICTITATANLGYTFVNWIENGSQVSTDASYSFVVTDGDDDRTFVANFTESQGTITQTSTLSQGWNWWSTYIEQEGVDGLDMLEEGLGNSGVTIRSQVGYTDYYAGYGWYGSLSSINNESSYKIKTDAPCSIIMTGNVAVPSQHAITLNQGWTWMGYVPSTAMGVNEALSGLGATAGDKLKSQQGYSDYYGEAYGWYGSLNTIEPGMGLMYYSTNGNPVTFIYPNSGRGGELKPNLTAEDNHWKPNIYAYPDNMTIMSVVELADMELSSDNYELAAFANGECRGSIKLTYVEPLHRHVAFLTISGKDAAELNFKLYDTETGIEYSNAEESLSFVANAIVGDASDLYVVHFKGTTGMDELANKIQVYPNPVNVGERFSINMNAESDAPIQVEIVNALGVETLRATSVQLPAQLTAPATAGVYTLRITVEGKEAVIRKLVVK